MAHGGLVFTLRKHWKKSVFTSVAFCYGLNYASERFREYLIRREYFAEAKNWMNSKFTGLSTGLDGKGVRLHSHMAISTIIENSTCKKSFMKNAAPIFFLAGIDVTYIQTNYEGHGKTIPSYFDPTVDGVVVAGGDGTLQEIVTGIMRQVDERVLRAPVGFIPLGYKSNSVYKRIFDTDAVNVSAMCKAAMAIVKGQTKRISILDVKTSEKSIYALSSLHIGPHQEVKEKLDSGKYWVLGTIRRYFAVIWRTIKNWPPTTSILFTANVDSTLQYNNISNGLSLYLKEDKDQAYLAIENVQKEISRMDFIRFGWKWIDSNFSQIENDLFNSMMCSSIEIEPQDSQNLSYDIDGEIYDPRTIKISIHPTKLNVFCEPLVSVSQKDDWLK